MPCLGRAAFFGVNGTKEQLDFFHFKLEPFEFCFWTGIQKDLNADKWITPLNEEITDDRLVWSTKSQPDNGFGNENCVVGWKDEGITIDYLHDNQPDRYRCKAVVNVFHENNLRHSSQEDELEIEYCDNFCVCKVN